DLDRVLLDLEAPCCDGPEVRLEADQRQHGVDLERLFLVGAVVEDGDCPDAVVAMDLTHLAVREQLDLPARDALVQLAHRLGVRPEPFPSMDQDEPARAAAQVEHPVDGAVAAAHDEYALALVRRGVLHVVRDTATEQLAVARALEHAWRERALPSCDQHRLRRIRLPVRPDDVALAVAPKLEHLLLEADIR